MMRNMCLMYACFFMHAAAAACVGDAQACLKDPVDVKGDDAAAMMQVKLKSVGSGDHEPEPRSVASESAREPSHLVEMEAAHASQRSAAAHAARVLHIMRSVYNESSKGTPLEVQMAEVVNGIYTVESTPDWFLAARKEVKSKWGKDKDIMGLYTQQNSKVCALAFAGSNSVADFTNNVKVSSSSFCGLDYKIHKGFGVETLSVQPSVSTMFKFITEELMPGSDTCSAGLYIAGHSLGAAIAEIFASCLTANKTVWGKGFPEVKALYTFAGPASSKKQLVDLSPAGKQRNGCFLGSRFYVLDDYWADSVPQLTRPFGFVHPKMKAVRLEEEGSWFGKKHYKKEEYACDSKKAKDYPNQWHVPSTKYHKVAEHIKRIKEIYR